MSVNQLCSSLLSNKNISLQEYLQANWTKVYPSSKPHPNSIMDYRGQQFCDNIYYLITILFGVMKKVCS